MSKQTGFRHLLAVSVVALALPIAALAAASRTFVATTCNDANVSSNCGATTPCRTFAVALSVTSSGGEIVVVSSGGYGPATITQPVLITAVGVDASISQSTSGQNGFDINTSGNVTLIGLNLHGEASGNDGIDVQQVGYLRLYNMLIENFTSSGVDFEVAGKLSIYGSEINDNGQFGLRVSNTSANAYVQNTSFDHNTIAGAAVGSGQLTIVDSSSSNNGNGFRSSGSGSTMTLVNDRAQFNAQGLWVDLDASLYFADCLIANNTMAYSISAGTLAGTNPGTSFIGPGQTTSGTLGTAVVLQ